VEERTPARPFSLHGGQDLKIVKAYLIVREEPNSGIAGAVFCFSGIRFGGSKLTLEGG
jgi:hypothetical protein